MYIRDTKHINFFQVDIKGSTLSFRALWVPVKREFTFIPTLMYESGDPKTYHVIKSARAIKLQWLNMALSIDLLTYKK